MLSLQAAWNAKGQWSSDTAIPKKEQPAELGSGFVIAAGLVHPAIGRVKSRELAEFLHVLTTHSVRGNSTVD